jgi:hypothetical protein
VFTVIQPEEGQVIQLFPSSQEGYLVNGLYNDKPHIIADGIVSEILSHKGNTYKVWDLGEDKPSFLVTDGNGNYAHGESLRDAQEDLVFKVVAKFDGDLPETAAGTEWVGIYRAVTGACSKGVKDFVLSIDMPFDAVYSAKEIIKLTEGKFGHEAFRAKYCHRL